MGDARPLVDRPFYEPLLGYDWAAFGPVCGISALPIYRQPPNMHSVDVMTVFYLTKVKRYYKFDGVCPDTLMRADVEDVFEWT